MSKIVTKKGDKNTVAGRLLNVMNAATKTGLPSETGLTMFIAIELTAMQDRIKKLEDLVGKKK